MSDSENFFTSESYTIHDIEDKPEMGDLAALCWSVLIDKDKPYAMLVFPVPRAVTGCDTLEYTMSSIISVVNSEVAEEYLEAMATAHEAVVEKFKKRSG